MPEPPFGRTGRAFPPRWLRLLVPDAGDSASELIDAAVASGLPLDLSIQPALWGGALRRHATVPPLVGIGGEEIAHADRATQAADFVQAHLLQTLSALGREQIDFYFLRMRAPLEEVQIAGALECLEAARQEGHVRHLGLFADAPPVAVLAMWQFHDAFDALLVRPGDAYDVLAPMARDRRVGVVSLGNGRGDVVLTSVRSRSTIEASIREHA